MHCYNSPNYNNNYYNNGAWENSCGSDVNSCQYSKNVCHQPSNSPNCQRITYIFSNIIDIQPLPQNQGGGSWSGCINVTLTNNNIKVKYLDTAQITSSLPIINDIYGIAQINTDTNNQFNIINPVNYTSYSCQTFSEAVLNIDLTNLKSDATSVASEPSSDDENTGLTYSPSSFTVGLPFKRSSVEQPLTLEGVSSNPDTGDSECGIPPINNSLCTINYCYSGFCNNITLTILAINITHISPIPVDTQGCNTY